MGSHGEAAEVKLQVEEGEEEAKAAVEIWKYVFGFTEMAVVKCAIELGIADTIENHHETSISLSDLSSKLNCSPSFLHRIMRFLIHRGIFKRNPNNGSYSQTALSRRLLSKGDTSMAAFILFESTPVMLSPWHNLSARVTAAGAPPFTAVHGDDVWAYATANPSHSRLIDEAMACDARVAVAAIVRDCPEVFDEIDSVVDVGGGNGTALKLLVKAFPGIRGINFDLPHVVSGASPPVTAEGFEHVGGDMFKAVPTADAAVLMWVLHDWSDSECVQILRNCREAVSKSKAGKVIIVEAVIDDNAGEEEEEEQGQVPEHKLRDVRLALDMVMMAHTNEGKERTRMEWARVLQESGFTKHTIKPMRAVQSVIEAFP